MCAGEPPSPANSVRFLLDGEVVSAPDLPPTMTVLEYLREVAHRTGTKEGCAEGDCGACTVVLGELTADGARVGYRAVNSCIRLLPTIDGQELVTVESLQARDGALHPVQQAMVDHHASQCGFCTPGFVMSLFALYLQSESPPREQVLEALSGNLCRCTGYRPIIDAAMRMGAYPAPANWSREAAHSSSHLAALRALRRTQALKFAGFCAPRSSDELATALEADPDAVLLAGGTDIGLWVTQLLRDLTSIIYIGEVAELKRIRSDAVGITISAAVPLTEGWAAIVAAYPQLAELAQRFGSPPVRNSGTLCGNIANGSPIGDAMPALIALGAQIELRRGSHTRQLPLERFYLGYQRKDLARGEFVVSVTVPAPRAGQRLASYKLSKRIDQDISAVCAAFVVERQGARIVAARVAFGGLAAIPARAHATENALIGKPWSIDTIESAAAALAEDFQPLTDLRASSSYRLQAAGNLLRRFYFETEGSSMPLRTAEAAAGPP
ncbi:MAG TPA: xanthine dehydrogenase small subunit [Steroidobacteraceae bacterium]|nr:xanthine dehydrogenase small subunit [Steroidobacteraceae bacterium]